MSETTDRATPDRETPDRTTPNLEAADTGPVTGGDLLAEALIAQGVDHIFGIPGIQLDAACDALWSRQDRIDFVCVRHEQAAAYAADGYARSSGREGVAMVVPGPGVLNALAGLATAYAANSPVLLIAGQVETERIGQGRGVLHELPDQTAILRGVTKWTARARRPDDIPGLVAEAFRELRSGRPRPVALEVPPDVLAARVPAGSVTIPGRVPVVASGPDPAELARVVELVGRARRPLIYAGGGVRAARASGELTRLAHLLGAPVVVTEDGRGVIDARDPLAFDPLAFRTLRESADLIIGVGTRFVSTFGGPLETGGTPSVLINVDPADLAGPRRPVAGLTADAGAGMRALADALEGTYLPEDRTGEIEAARAYVAAAFAQITPQREWLAALRNALPSDGVLVSELTQVGYAAGIAFPAHHASGCLGAGYAGTLGFGFATAIGAQAADPGRAVVSVTGDGGFSWTLAELSTLRRYGLGLVTVVFTDGAFGNVRRIQRDNYGGRLFASDLTNPDYRTLADAFGIRSALAYDPGGLERAVREALDSREPTLVEVRVGEFPSPWHLVHEGLPTPAPLPAGADRLTPGEPARAW